MYQLIRPLLFRLDAERAHELTARLLRLVGATPAARLLDRRAACTHPALSSTLAGLSLRNPLGLAAGFDKHGDVVRPLAMLGFGHIEVGTVTPRAQPGNPQPRMFRLPADRALINRMGFNNPGMLTVAQRLRRVRRAGCVVGINIGKNRTTPNEHAADDYLAAFVALAPYADYVAVNISSPNTPGLRALHQPDAIRALLTPLVAANVTLQRPILVKLSPDEPLAAIADVVQVGRSLGISGFIVANTTVDRSGLSSAHTGEVGGLSGRPLEVRTRALIATVARLTDGALPVIGVGGIDSAAAAYAHIRAGAQLVQLYTGLVYQGPWLPVAICGGLVALAARDGFASVTAAIGVDRDKDLFTQA